jgi:UDP-glucuronate decarboxylase
MEFKIKMYDTNKDTLECIRKLGPDVKRFSGKTILLAGGAGFLGRHFIALFRELNKNILDKPCRVFSIDNFITGDRNAVYGDGKLDPNITEVWADVTAPLPIREDLDFIIQAAGVASPVFYMKYPLETIESAVQGTKSLMELARRNPNLEGVLYFSSSEIYGDPDPAFVPTPETYHGYVSSTGPRACYDESKRLGETISVIYHQKYNIPVKIVRPFNVFGPGMKHNDRRVVPMFTYEALNKRPLSIHGDGRQTRTFCYISDAITGFLQVLLRGTPGEAYNIGNSNNEISMADLALNYTKLIPGCERRFIDYPETYPAGEPQRRCPDLSKAKSHFNYKADVEIEEGLKRFIDWASTQVDYVSKG